MQRKQIIISALLGLGLAWGLASSARADDAAGTDSDYQSLDARVSALEQRLALLSPVSGTPTAFQGSPASAFASVNRGIGFVSADGTYGIQFSGTLQEDLRQYFDSGLNAKGGVTAALPGEFVLAKARLLIDAFLGPRVHVRYQEDFSNNGSNSGSSNLSTPDGAQLVDAYGELRLLPWTLLRVGQFKSGLDIERWRQTPAAEWIQNGYTSNLVVDRDQGAELEVVDPQQIFYLSGGVFDGDTDTGGNAVVSSSNPNKDAISRLFFQPLNGISGQPLGNLALGVSGSGGNHTGDTEQGYKSLGQESIFTASGGTAGTTYTEGAGYRLIPQAYWFWKQFDAIAEYVHEWDEYRVVHTVDDDIYADTEGWDAGVGWVLTGEQDTYNGIKLDKDSEPWGALQLVARVEGVDYDEDAFAKLASPLASVKSLTSWSVGLNYIPVNDVKFLLDYDVTQFQDGAETVSGKVADRVPEEALQGRVQFAF